jgi:hypothetical protein
LLCGGLTTRTDYAPRAARSVCRSGGDPPLGALGGWRDLWDDPDDHAELRAHAEATERCLEAAVARIGRRWQREIGREQARKRRGGLG